MVIGVVNQRGLIGYIKSYSTTKGTFSLTQEMCQAKKYKSEAYIQDAIDKLTLIGYNGGYVFTIIEG